MLIGIGYNTVEEENGENLRFKLVSGIDRQTRNLTIFQNVHGVELNQVQMMCYLTVSCFIPVSFPLISFCMIRHVYPRTRRNRTFPACIAITFGRARQDKISKTRQDKTRQDKTRQDKTRQDKTGQDRTGQDRTGQDRTGQDRTGQDRTGQDRTGQDRTGQDRTGQDRTGQDKTRQDKTRQDLLTYTLTNYRACFNNQRSIICWI